MVYHTLLSQLFVKYLQECLEKIEIVAVHLPLMGPGGAI